MAYPVFPVMAAPNYPLKESLYKPKVRTEFESGAVQSRDRFTRSKKRFSLEWSKLDDADKVTLERFFDSTGAGRFAWKHPLTGKQYVCIFSDDSFDADLVELDFWDVKLNIEEI